MDKETKHYLKEFILLIIASITGAFVAIDVGQTYFKNPNLLANFEASWLIGLVKNWRLCFICCDRNIFALHHINSRLVLFKGYLSEPN